VIQITLGLVCGFLVVFAFARDLRDGELFWNLRDVTRDLLLLALAGITVSSVFAGYGLIRLRSWDRMWQAKYLGVCFSLLLLIMIGSFRERDEGGPGDAISFFGFFALVTLPYLPIAISSRWWGRLCGNDKEPNQPAQNSSPQSGK
jgi:hypothetical protein